MQRTRSLHRAFLPLLLLLAVQFAAAQKGALQIDHTVSLEDPASQQFHITSRFKNINQVRLDLSLPTWTPGWYTVENYYKNVLRLRITDANGKVLPHTMSRKQTWNVDTRGIREIRVDFDYRATVLGLNQARIAQDFAFFTGIQLFLEPVGHRSSPSTVRFRVPDRWKVISALKETGDPMVFTAADYDTLVDAPTEMGNFDVTRFDVEGKPHYFVATPAGAFSKDKSDRFVGLLSRTFAAQSAIFGGLPFEKYVTFYFFTPAESNASGALEHLNSFVAFAPPGDVATPEMLIGTASHEFFHLWNVKRIRPAEMWPYDYSRENESPLLWVSEGFTNYYGVVATYRAGITSQEAFLQRAADAASGIENSEARHYISPAEASVSTWVGYDTPVAFGISYYTQGQNLGALLDLSIRNDTDGRRSLDDVMRTLYSEFYRRGRGFTTEDMIQAINRLTRKDYHEFYRRYVFGTDVPNYGQIFGYAGYSVEEKSDQVPEFGFFSRFRSGGLAINGVEPNSPASVAGLRRGDVITKINGQQISGFPFNTLAGKTVTLTVEREGTQTTVPMTVGSRTVKGFKLVDTGRLTDRQRRVRESWLKR